MLGQSSSSLLSLLDSSTPMGQCIGGLMGVEYPFANGFCAAWFLGGALAMMAAAAGVLAAWKAEADAD